MSKVKLYLGDCLEILPTLTENIDVVITDPPYGINLETNYGDRAGGRRFPGAKNYDKIIGDDKPFDFKLWADFYPKEQFWFGAENFLNLHKINNSWLCWDKYPTDKNDKRYSGQFELIWSKQKHKRVLLRIKAINTSWVTVKEREDHPTQKPVDLMVLLIEKYTKKGDLIFDPYMGTCPTGVACVQTGRNFIGIEIIPKYFEIAEKRIAEAQLQMRFDM